MKKIDCSDPKSAAKLGAGRGIKIDKKHWGKVDCHEEGGKRDGSVG